jgi:hypothetical protein
LVALLAASILAAPHVSTYDTLLLAIAAALLFCRALKDGAALYAIVVMLAAWLLPLFPPRARPVGLMTPLIVAALIAIAMTGLRRMAQPPRHSACRAHSDALATYLPMPIRVRHLPGASQFS